MSGPFIKLWYASEVKTGEVMCSMSNGHLLNRRPPDFKLPDSGYEAFKTNGNLLVSNPFRAGSQGKDNSFSLLNEF